MAWDGDLSLPFPESTMPTERRRIQNPDIPRDENRPQRNRSSTAQLEYERLMVEAKQAFDRVTSEHAMARSARTARRAGASTTTTTTTTTTP